MVLEFFLAIMLDFWFYVIVHFIGGLIHKTMI